uniref:Uncharacterized protein n=1 Tax=Rhizophora mucronata TaxID=61149 RepID=A0A2P2LAG2_RHIMU
MAHPIHASTNRMSHGRANSPKPGCKQFRSLDIKASSKVLTS